MSYSSVHGEEANPSRFCRREFGTTTIIMFHYNSDAPRKHSSSPDHKMNLKMFYLDFVCMQPVRDAFCYDLDFCKKRGMAFIYQYL